MVHYRGAVDEGSGSDLSVLVGHQVLL